MDRDTAVAVIKQKSGWRTDKDAQIITALQTSQEVLEKGGLATEAGYATEVPWFLRKDDQPLSLAAGATTIALPSDFLREVEDEGPWLADTTSTSSPPTYLAKAGSGAARRTFIGLTSGPQIYQVRNTDLFLFPAFEDALTLYWSYYGKDVILDTNVENQWLKWVPNLLIGHAGQGFANDLRDKDAAEEFKRMKLEGQRQLMILNVSREVTNRRTSIGRYR